MKMEKKTKKNDIAHLNLLSFVCLKHEMLRRWSFAQVVGRRLRRRRIGLVESAGCILIVVVYYRRLEEGVYWRLCIG